MSLSVREIVQTFVDSRKNPNPPSLHEDLQPLLALRDRVDVPAEVLEAILALEGILPTPAISGQHVISSSSSSSAPPSSPHEALTAASILPQMNNIHDALAEAFERDAQAINPLSASVHLADFNSRQRAISEWHNDLLEKQSQFESDNARVQLASLMEARDTMAPQLQSAGLTGQVNSHDALMDAKRAFPAYKTGQQGLQQQLAKCAQQLAPALSAEKLQAEISHQEATLESQLAKFQQVKALLSTCEQSWIEEWTNTSDPGALASQARIELRARQSWASYFSIFEWKDWYTKPEYTANIQRSGCFLLLEEQALLLASIEGLTQSISKNKEILSSHSGTASSSTDTPVNPLDLLKQVPAFRDFSDTGIDAQYTALTEAVGLVGQEIQRREDLITTLADLQNQIRKLRKAHRFSPDLDDITLDPSKIAKLRTESETRASAGQENARRRQLCEEFQKLAEEYTRLAPPKRVKPGHTRRKKIVTPDSAIRSQILKLETWLAAHEPLIPTTQISAPVADPPLPNQTITIWVSRIRPLLQGHGLPAALQGWFERLVVPLQTIHENSPVEAQASQLLRDILFEVNHVTQYPQRLVILEDFMTSCPEPESGWQHLVNTQLPFPILSAQPAIQDARLRQDFQVLQAQEAELRTRGYGLEADLLGHARTKMLEAVVSVETRGMQRCGTMEPLHVQINMLDQPGYECLQRHRGIYRIFERIAEWATSVRAAIFGQQPANAYRKSCFFKPTQSIRLLEQTQEHVSQLVN